MDWAPNVTPRMKFQYKAAGLTHVAQLRVERDSSVGPAAAVMRDAISGLFFSLRTLLADDFVFLAASYAVQDDDVFTPGFTLPTAVTGTVDVDLFSHNACATQTRFQGIGGGSKISLEVFGVFWDLSDVSGPAANGRVASSESAPIATAVDTLNSAAGLATIGNAPVTWYSFANVKVNDYWLKQARKLFT